VEALQRIPKTKNNSLATAIITYLLGNKDLSKEQQIEIVALIR